MLKSRDLNALATILLVSVLVSGCGSTKRASVPIDARLSSTASVAPSSADISAAKSAHKSALPPPAAHMQNPFESAAFSIIAEREVQGLNADILKYFGVINDDDGRKIFNQACQDCKDDQFDKAIDGFYKAVASLPPLKKEAVNRGNNPIIELHVAILQFGALDCSKFGEPAKGLKLLTDAENFTATLPGPATYEQTYVYDAHCSAKANQYDRAVSAFKSIEKKSGSMLTKANARVAQARMLDKAGKPAEAEKVRVEAQKLLETAGKVSQLISVCQSGTLEQAETLVRSGISAKGYGVQKPHHLSAYSPLMNTIMSGDKPDLVEFLLKNGADVNETDFAGATPLHLAAKYNDVRSAKVLVANGAKVDAVCAEVAPGNLDPLSIDNHLTPLMIAAENNNLEMVQLLVDVGHANLQVENGEHKNAADLATDEKILAYLSTKKATPGGH